MKASLNKAIIFLSGASIGSLVTWLLVKEKYRIKCEERIAENREAFRIRLDEIYETSSKKAKASINKPDIKNFNIDSKENNIEKELPVKSYESILNTIDNSTNKIDYTKFFPKDDSEYITTEVDLNNESEDKNIEDYVQYDSYTPYNDATENSFESSEDIILITKEDYMYSNENDHLTLTLYSDGTVADEMEEEVEDYESLIGYNPTQYFTSNNDSVFLRNNKRTADIELIKDDRTFIEVKEDYM